MKDELIVKSNDLIQARYELGLMEQKLILYAVSKIDTNKENFTKVHIEVKQITQLIDSTVKRYTEFREIANNLMDRRVYLADRPNLDVRWVASSEYLGDGIIELEFSEKLIPYLLKLKTKFTRYQLKNILHLKNKYSIRLYELLKQYENLEKRTFSLDELKGILMIDNMYSDFRNLSQFVLKPSMSEINKHTDLVINYEKITKGRKVVGIKYSISPKDLVGKQYIEYLDKEYDIFELKQMMGVEKECFNSKQIIEIYTLAINKTINSDENVSPFEYIRLNYINMIQKNTARNKYSYLLKYLENDYASALAQLKLNYIIDV